MPTPEKKQKATSCCLHNGIRKHKMNSVNLKISNVTNVTSILPDSCFFC